MSSEPTTLGTVVQLYLVLQTLLGIEGKIEEGGSATCDFTFRRKPTNSMARTQPLTDSASAADHSVSAGCM